MIQGKMDDICREHPNVFRIADDILIVGCKSDGTDRGKMLRRVLHISRKENLKRKSKKAYHKCYFMCTSASISWYTKLFE